MMILISHLSLFIRYDPLCVNLEENKKKRIEIQKTLDQCKKQEKSVSSAFYLCLQVILSLIYFLSFSFLSGVTFSDHGLDTRHRIFDEDKRF
jgi:hypothetical protein